MRKFYLIILDISFTLAYYIGMKRTYDSTYFNAADTLECGQVFRFKPYCGGYLVCSADKICFVKTEGDTTTVESDDIDYFENYFDLSTDYSKVIDALSKLNIPTLNNCMQLAKGLRLLNQDREEVIYSFIISQNNNIPRIKIIIERLCMQLGEKRYFMGEPYYTFPTSQKLATCPPSFFKELGAGYRDEYLAHTAQAITLNGIEHLNNLDSATLKKELLKYKGIGPKVADCVMLFGFSKMGAFPVDTWVIKVYKEDFSGTLSDPVKINKFFVDTFGELSGYAQQYLFYGKRSLI